MKSYIGLYLFYLLREVSHSPNIWVEKLNNAHNSSALLTPKIGLHILIAVTG